MSAQRSDDHDNLEAVVLAWLAQLYDNIDDGWLTLFSLDRTTGGRPERIDWAPVDDYDALVAHATRRSATCDVWWGVATRNQHLARGRGGDDDCAFLPALWVDIDIAGPGHKTDQPLPPDVAAARRILDGYPLPPTAVVHSGGGLQAWWVLDEPLPAGDARPILERWGHTWRQLGARHGWHIDSVFDVARVMRLPGTWNRKTSQPRPVVVTDADWARRYGLDDLDQHLDDPPAPAAPQKPTQAPWTGPQRPGDAFNEAHTTSDVLAAAGWQLARTDRNGDQQWVRPGKDARQGTSATVYGSEDGHVTVWSDAVPGVDTRRPYDAFGLHTVLHHAGDYTASSDALEQQGYGTKRRPDDLSWVHVGTEDSGGGGVEPPTDADHSDVGRLPDDFWDARPVLTQIRQAAHSRMISADALLHIILARVASQTPHTLVLPPTIGDEVTLAYFVCVVSVPGVGKSSANGVARRLLPAPDWVLDQIPPGSGEGLAELFFATETDIDADGKTITVKRQVKHNAYVYADEGQAVSEIGARKGSTLLTTMRSMWMGGVLGQANASKDTYRVLPALSYIFGMTLALQDTKAATLLDDADGGTPQRFGWAWADDPTIPDDEPPWPGEIDWAPPARIAGHSLELDPDITAEVRAAHKAKMRREVEVDTLDTHGNLYQLKVAGLLAVLDKRDHVDLDDWALAAIIRDASNGVRGQVIDTVARDAARREQAATDKHVRREVAADAAVERRRIVECAQRVQSKVVAKPGMSPSDLKRDLKRWRDVADAGIEHAIAEGWVAIETAPGRGTEKQMLVPGKRT